MRGNGKQRPFEIDFSVLVDIISNAAGMMILFACMSLFVETDGDRLPAERDVKAIDFPLSYLPMKKRPITIAMKDGKLYRLPAGDLLKEVLRMNAKKQPVNYLDVEKDGVLGRIQFTPLGLGYRFFYRLLPDGGTPMDRPIALKRELDALLKQFPPEMYYVSIYCWSDQFAHLKDVREYLIEKRMVVGWSGRIEDGASWHLMFARGDYDERLSSIKAQ